jgi:hypothetical protein
LGLLELQELLSLGAWLMLFLKPLLEGLLVLWLVVPWMQP